MKTRPSTTLVLMLASLLAAMLALVAGCSVRLDAAGSGDDAWNVSQRISDAGVSARIRTAYLFTPHLSAYRINVDTSSGVVTLAGAVRSQIQKDLADEIARGALGVVAVRNQLRVGEGPVREPDEIDRAFSQSVVDATVSASVKTALGRDAGPAATAIDVTTRRGTVTLRGSVPTSGEKDLAERIARDTPGVRDVDNQLDVEG